MSLPNPSTSRAVLIGASEYDTLEPLPAVARNLARLTELITDTALWGLPAEHVKVLLNPASRDDVLDAIHDAAAAADDAILVYYAGHGLLEPQTSALHLALPGASLGRLHRALRYDELRREITRTCQALHKVVLLDCCYSGRAMEGFMSASPDMADQAGIEGTYLMTASAETVLALAEPGEEYTAFTGELVQAIERGVPDGPDLMDMGTLYFQVRANLIAKGRPEPQERARNDGRSITLLRNRYGTGAAANTEHAEPYSRLEPPTGYEHLLRRPPRETLEAVQRLRDEGLTQDADLLLAAIASRRPDQELAATLQLLFHSHRAADAGVALREAARRPAREVMALWEALRELGESDIVRALIAVVAEGSIDQMVSVASLLSSAVRREDKIALLDAGAAAHPDTEATINLIAALWTAGATEEIDRLLAVVSTRIGSAQTLDLADALRTAGREDAAFGLYVRSADVLARRPPGEIASIAHAMQVDDRVADAHLVVNAALRARDTAAAGYTMIEELWSADYVDLAIHATEASAFLLPPDQVLPMLDALCTGEHSETIFNFCKAALAWRPSTIAIELVDRLQDLGQPVTANRFLASLPEAAPDKVVHIIHELAELGRLDDIDRLLDRVRAAGPEEKARVIACFVFGPALGVQIGPLISQSIGQYPGPVAEYLQMLPSAHSSEVLIRSLLHRFLTSHTDAANCYELFITHGAIDWAGWLLHDHLSLVTDMSSAVDMIIAFARLDLGPAITPLLPGNIGQVVWSSPPIMLAVAAQVLHGTLPWGFTAKQIGTNLPEALVAGTIAALRARWPGSAKQLLENIAVNRPAKDIPAILAQLEQVNLREEIITLLREVNQRRPQTEVRYIRSLLLVGGLTSWSRELTGNP